MHRKRLSSRKVSLFLSACVVAAVSGSAIGAPPVDTRFTYQGRLSDNGVLANGTYDILFSVYDVSAGGAALAGSFFNDVTVTNGLFQVEVNFPAAVYAPGAKRWMQVEVRPGASVGSFSILGTRQELLTVPFATKSLIPNTLQEAYNAGSNINTINPVTIFAPVDYNALPGTADALHITQGQIRLGNVPDGGRGQLFLNNAATSGYHSSYLGTSFAGTVAGDALVGWSTGGTNSDSFFGNNLNFYLGPALSAAGGYLSLTDSLSGTFSTGVNFSGNGGKPYGTINGATGLIKFDPENSVADNKVILPNGSIMSPEIGDEPGVASNGDGNGLTTINSGITILSSRTITAPAAGWVFAIATAQVNITHVGGTEDNFDLGVSPNPAALPVNQDVGLVIPGAWPTALTIYPMTVQGLFPVSAGANTFYYLSNKRSGGSLSVNDTQLTLVYFPTAYGSVNPQALIMGGGNDATNVRRPTIGVNDIVAEQNQSVADNMARVERENADMRKRLEEIEAQLKNMAKPGSNSTRRVEGSEGVR